MCKMFESERASALTSDSLATEDVGPALKVVVELF